MTRLLSVNVYEICVLMVNTCVCVCVQDALVNLIRRARPVFLQCLSVKTDAGVFDVPSLRVQLHSTHLLPALHLYRTGLTHTHMFRVLFKSVLLFSPHLVRLQVKLIQTIL